MLPFGVMMAGNVSAADEVIYVKDGGTGDGSSEANAFGSLTDAVTAAAALTNDAEVVIVGEFYFDISTAAYSTPKHTNKITIRGKDNTAKLSVKTGKVWSLGGELEICNLNIDLVKNTSFTFTTLFYPITFGEGLNVTNSVDTTAEKKYLSVRSVGKTDTTNAKLWNATEGKFIGDSTITIKSGRFEDVVLFGQNGNDVTRTLDGTINLVVQGDPIINNLVVSRSANFVCTNANITLDGGTIGRFVGATDRKYTAGIVKYGPSGVTGTFTLYITKNFDLAGQSALIGTDESNTTEFVLALCGATANKDYAGALDDANLGTYVLKADAEVFNAVKAETVKINQATFDKVIKVSADNANTGDATVVFAVVACISLAAVVVFSKKRTTR